MVYHQCSDPLRPGHPYRLRCHPQKKQQAPSQTTISFKPPPAIPIKGQYPTETETKMAKWPVTRSKRFPHWREPHHVRKSTGWTRQLIGLRNTLYSDCWSNKKNCIFIFVYINCLLPVLPHRTLDITTSLMLMLLIIRFTCVQYSFPKVTAVYPSFTLCYHVSHPWQMIACF
jgi:hypothetical protein